MNDFDLSSKERLINLVNRDNVNNQYGIVLTDASIEFGTPTALAEGDKNTEIVIDSKPNTFTVGSVTVRYNRLDLNGLKDLADVPIILSEEDTTTAAVLEQINNVYGSNITEDDLEEFTIGEVDRDGTVVTLVAKEDNLAWINQIELLVKLDQELLSTVFVHTSLAGLKWPGVLSAALVGEFERVGTSSISIGRGNGTGALINNKLYIVASQGTASYATVLDLATKTFTVNSALIDGIRTHYNQQPNTGSDRFDGFNSFTLHANSDGQLVLFGYGTHGNICYFDMVTGTVVKEIPAPSSQLLLNDAGIFDEEIAYYNNKQVKIFDYNDVGLEEKLTLDVPHSGWLYQPAIFLDRRYLIVYGGSDQSNDTLATRQLTSWYVYNRIEGTWTTYAKAGSDSVFSGNIYKHIDRYYYTPDAMQERSGFGIIELDVTDGSLDRLIAPQAESGANASVSFISVGEQLYIAGGMSGDTVWRLT